MKEMIILKMNLLDRMNQYIIDLGDEEAWELWIETFPDEVTEDDLREIAADEELWTDCCILFGKIVNEFKM